MNIKERRHKHISSEFRQKASMRTVSILLDRAIIFERDNIEIDLIGRISKEDDAFKDWQSSLSDEFQCFSHIELKVKELGSGNSRTISTKMILHIDMD